MTIFMVTGSRYWTDIDTVLNALLVNCEAGDTMLNGACPTGADEVSDRIWTKIFDFPIKKFPADWARFGKRASFIRNSDMVKHRPAFCLAFPLKGYENRGTKMTMELAKKSGIPVIEIPGERK